MKIIYIANARIPTEKAHGIAILKACESFARTGATVRLVVPRRRTSRPDVFKDYGLEHNFHLQFLPTIDLYGFIPNRLAFYVQSATFYVSVKLWLLFRSRSSIIYTRDAPVLFFAWLGYRIIYECHHLSSLRGLHFFASRRADRIITISKALKQVFVAAGFEESHIFVAPSGVDLSTFDIDISKEDARKQLDLPKDKNIAVYTGNFTTMGQDKGIADIIEALKETPDAFFVAVGGSEEDIARYAVLAREAGISDRVVLRGHTSQKILAVYQKAADELLMPFPDTPHYRNHMSPVKMFEYMASGRPIIASDLPTIREVLNEENAYIVPPGNSRALAAALQDIVSDAPRTAMISARALRLVRTFTWDERSGRIMSFVAKP